jgi:hypothetical protein
MARLRQLIVLFCAAAWITVLAATGGCGSNPESGGDLDGSAGTPDGQGTFGTGPDGGMMFGADDGGIPAPCPGGGLGCYVPQGCTTSLSGTVYDPAGRNPLYNVVVYVPNDPYGTLPPITPGTSTCSACDVNIAGNYIAVATSDAQGHFTLTGVPATSHVPLVVQTGKWRREVFLPPIAACTDNPVAAANSRLPRNHMEGDLPQMALLTGGCDDLGCFMKSMGIDDAEYTAPHGGGRLDIYQGVGLNRFGASLTNGRAGNCTGPNCPLWASKKSFEYYDIAILSCECAENNQTKPAAGMSALRDWLDEGGKVFASHYHYTWFKNNPSADFRGVANWLGPSNAQGMGNFLLDQSFPKGKTYHDWLANVKALNANGSIALTSVATSVTTVNPPTTRWIYDGNNNETKYLSFLTPIGGMGGPIVTPPPTPEAGSPAPEAGADASGDASQDASEEASHEASVDAASEAAVAPVEAGTETTTPLYCGKAVFTDLHTSSGIQASVSDIPGGCSGAPMTAQQKALEFLFFDLSACVAIETIPPPLPSPPAK